MRQNVTSVEQKEGRGHNNDNNNNKGRGYCPHEKNDKSKLINFKFGLLLQIMI